MTARRRFTVAALVVLLPLVFAAVIGVAFAILAAGNSGPVACATVATSQPHPRPAPCPPRGSTR